jgi:AcrR family transcriptional regulator
MISIDRPAPRMTRKRLAVNSREAGVAKISMYRGFASKDDLIVAYLEDNGRVFLDAWDKTFDAYRDAPRQQLRAIMTYVAERTEEKGYRGCPYINFSSEFPDPSRPGRRVAAGIKQAIRDRFLRLANELKPRDPQRLADAWLLLFERAYALSQTLGASAGVASRSLVWAAESLADAQSLVVNADSRKKRHVERTATKKKRS